MTPSFIFMRRFILRQASTIQLFVKSILASALTGLCMLVLVYVLTEFASFPYKVSIIVAYVFGSLMNFILLKWVFVGGAQKNSREFSFYIVLVLSNLLINEAITHVLVEFVHVWYMLAQVLVIGLLSIINFFVYRSCIFPRRA